MSADNRMVPVTLMIDPTRHRKLKTASKSTRISMSELVRVAVDRLMLLIGDPKRPDPQALARLLNSTEEGEGMIAQPSNNKGRRKKV